ncbi:hypothetical protein [Novosphingobium album (ex Hu et al. 2023)]|uniref:Hybrid sensor histidine kinase/response regulator n=1 Tax=Novosphingobium album (ex Hu et al. 2023) TaxID=2930093 RepID=A0ABT0B0K4_9SPHN|nr:hypothetical protein [Novosphingobium album (ex Hu et al. 2023)]MCJ2178540.1 hypothetical protein [Novosphingobium album (ex Hu et al. 2023)]
MSKRFSQEQLQGLASVSDSPSRLGADRKAELPRGLYALAAAVYLAVLGVTALLFLEAGLALSMMILANLVVLAFGFAGRWAKAKPGYDTAPVARGSSSRTVSIL